MSVRWSDVVADQKRWTDQVCRHLDDWSPEPHEMPARRASAFSALRRRLRCYVDAHGETLRATFRLALSLDIHRRFVHIHGHDLDDEPLELYTACKHDPTLATATWAGEPLEPNLDRCIVDFAADVAKPDPDPDVMTADGTTDLRALVMLAEHRRRLVALLESDLEP